MVSLRLGAVGGRRSMASAGEDKEGTGDRRSLTPRFVRSRRLATVVEAVGNTPLVRLERVSGSAPSVEVYLKIEFANPGGSVKDRPALRMIQDALADGRLTPDKTLIDST